MYKSEDRSQLSTVFHINISCADIRIHDHAKVKGILLKWSVVWVSLCLSHPSGRHRRGAPGAVAGFHCGGAFGTDGLWSVLTDEIGIGPLDCNLEIPSCACQLWAHATGASRLMRPIFNKLEMSPRCQVSQSPWKKPTGQIDPLQQLLNLYENVRFDLSKFIQKGRDGCNVSCLADECDWIINNSSAFRRAVFLGRIWFWSVVWSAGVFWWFNSVTDLIRFVLRWCCVLISLSFFMKCVLAVMCCVSARSSCHLSRWEIVMTFQPFIYFISSLWKKHNRCFLCNLSL